MDNTFPQDLIREDINLLVTLYYLIEFKHVGKVAEQLYISQSAVSQQLNKLRHTFDDQLLVRVQNKMVPTQVAMKLHPLLHRVLDSVGQVYKIKNKELIPSKNNYSICMINCAASDLVTKLFFNMSKTYENTSFQMTDRYHDCINDFLRGDIDFLIGSYTGLPNSIHQAHLMDISYSAYVRKDHPLVNSTAAVSIFELNKYQIIELEAHESADSTLRIRDIAKPSLKLSKYETVASILKESNAICFLPDNLFNTSDLISLNLSFPKLVVNCRIYWHELMSGDLFHNHLKEELININGMAKKRILGGGNSLT
ncbi:LysR family transcriptional regulator [Shewanella violacea]|uniref:Transcriptional regulator, LysR family n=1 Tax=Shewanella violacea (strain JCM 10179 / CIP 106290 / LMG 19151 / DSS12) TaxID=637905 RepID=D4ZJJ6_SHEVD|nr:LysR family transcriptional regulator [Shewanella violacea]BAJ01845.1 transcriptional regulator, LysR family [Shewanella violacea DSS12]